MEIGKYLLDEWVEESASTKKMLERIPEDRFQWKPHDKSRSLGELAQHVAAMTSWFIPVFESDSFDPMQHKQPTLANKADMLKLFDDGSAELTKRLKSTPEDEYDKQWNCVMNGNVVATMSKAMALRGWLFDHMIHHRAQLSVYLRLLDVPVPGMYGPSADEE